MNGLLGEFPSDSQPRRRPRPRALTLVLALTILACLGLALWLVARPARPARTPAGLEVREIGSLAAAGRYEAALKRVETALEADPGNRYLRVMAAQLALDRPDPQPERALAHLGHVRSTDSDSDASLTAQAKLAEGRAAYAMSHYDQAEICWLEALKRDPTVPEAAWALLDLYYLEGRSDEARRLALGQHEIEPDPHDRVQFLLELVRQDAEPPEPGSLAARFAPVVRAHPGDRHSAIALGLALVRNSQGEQGLPLLEDATRRWPESRDSWDALFTGLDIAGQPGRLAEIWDRVPARWRDDDGLARHAGNAAAARGDFATAARAYRRAWAARPDDRAVAYRLARVLHALGQHDQAECSDRFAQAAQAVQAELLTLYKQANALKDLGRRPHTRLYHRLADNRERLGRRDEARAWHRLVLRDRPADLSSRNALERLQSQGPCIASPSPEPAAAGAHDGRADRAEHDRPRTPRP